MEDTIPLIDEPKVVTISGGKIKPHTAVVTCNNKLEITVIKKSFFRPVIFMRFYKISVKRTL